MVTAACKPPIGAASPIGAIPAAEIAIGSSVLTTFGQGIRSSSGFS
jgi:hypothetical protein